MKFTIRLKKCLLSVKALSVITLVIILSIQAVIVPEQTLFAKAESSTPSGDIEPQTQTNAETYQDEKLELPISLQAATVNDPSVIFNMTGYAGQWSVCLDGMRQYTSAKQIVFSNVPSGTYYYTVFSETSGYIAQPSSGSITVADIDITVNVAFASNPTVTFAKTGFTGQWSVCFNGMRQYTSAPTLSFANIPNGTYYYTVFAESNGWTTSPSSGNVTVSGANVVVNVAFTSLPMVTFTRSGSYGGQWEVSLNGMLLYSSGSSISFSNVPKGTYYYTIVSESSGWIVSPSSGIVTVIDSDVNLNVAFTPLASVIFNRLGSYNGQWEVSLNGMLIYTSGPTISFSSVPNGTYRFTINSESSGWISSPSTGTLTVSGSNITVGVTFTSLPTVTFTETGYSGTWAVCLNGMRQYTSGSTISFANVPKGTYSYTIWSETSGWTTPSSSGTITVTGASVNVPVTFGYNPTSGGSSSITITETGLPSGTQWGVSIAGVSKYSTTSTIQFTGLASGIYPYVIISQAAYTGFLVTSPASNTPIPTPLAGSVNLQGSASVSISFSPLTSLTFTQSGLTRNWWSVSANGMFSGWKAFNGGSITLYNVPQGTNVDYVVADNLPYSAGAFFTVSSSIACPIPPNADTVSPNAGTVNAVFSASNSLTFTQSGLTRNWWSVSANGMFSGWKAFNGGSITFYNVPQANIDYVISDNIAYSSFISYSSGNWSPIFSPYAASISPNFGTVNIVFSPSTTLTFAQTGLTSNYWSVSTNGMFSGWYAFNGGNITFFNVPQGANVDYVVADGYTYSAFLTANSGGWSPICTLNADTINPSTGKVNVVFLMSGRLTFTQTGLPRDYWSISANGMFSGWNAFNGASINFYNVPIGADINYLIAGSLTYSGFLTGSGYAAVYYPTVISGSTRLSIGNLTGSIPIVFKKLPSITFAELNLPPSAQWSSNIEGMSQQTTSNAISFVNAPYNNALAFQVSPPTTPTYYANPPNGTLNIGTFDFIQLIAFSTTPPSSGAQISSSTLVVHVVDTAGNPISGAYVTYYDQTQNPIGALPADSSGYTDPIQLPSTIFLGANPLRLPYYTPALQAMSLSQGSNIATITLTPYPTGLLTGTVTYQNGSAFAGATVNARQTINGVDFVNTTKSNSQGQYSLNLIAGLNNVRVSATGYFAEPQNATIPANGIASLSTIINTLQPASVTVNVYTKFLGDQAWTGPLPIDWIEAVHFGIRIVDAMGYLRTVTSNPYTFLGYAGEQIQVYANGVEAGLPSATQTVTLDTNRNAQVSLYLGQQGLIKGTVTYQSQAVKSWTANIYSINPDGSRVFVLSKANNGAAFTFNPPSPGQYEFDFQGVATALTILGGSKTVTVQSAQVLDLGNIELQSQILFTGTANNGVVAIPNQVSPGQTFDLRATYQNSAASLSNVTFLLEIPAETSLVPGSITLNQQQVNVAVLSGNYYSVSAKTLSALASGTLTYRLIVSEKCEATSLNPSVLIHYTYSFIEYTETIGSINVLVNQVTINAPTVLGSLNTKINGQSPPSSKITIFDNETIIGQVSASPNGYWQLNATLPNANYHGLHAQATTLQGATLNSATLNVIYDSTKPQLILVTMQQSNSREISFNPQDGVSRFPYVVVPHVPINFALTFSNISRISDVCVIVDGCEVANASLGTDGLYHATVHPESALGSIYVEYNLLPFPKGDGSSLPILNLTSLSSQFPNTVYTVTSNNTNMAANITFPNGGKLNGNIQVIPDVKYTLTARDIEDLNNIGYPLFGSDVSFTNSSSQMSVNFTFFIPYYALPANLVRQIDGPAQSVASVLNGILIIGTATGDPLAAALLTVVSAGQMAISFASDLAAMTILRDRLQVVHDYFDYCKKIAEQSGCTTQMAFIKDKMAAYNDVVHNLLKELTGAVLSDGLSAVPSDLLSGAGNSYCHDLFAQRIDGYVRDVEKIYRDVVAMMRSSIQSGKISHTPNPTAQPNWVYDPSGYVYEGISSNRLPDVTASIFYQDQNTGQWIMWDATEYGQQNNILTDTQGSYGWYVPQGKWMVTYTKPGYLSTQSGTYNVPPPATDVNIGMIPASAPTITATSATAANPSTLTIQFNQYMKANALNQNNIYIQSNGVNVVGIITPLNPQQDPNSTVLTKAVIFTPSSPFHIGDTYQINVKKEVQNFAGYSMVADYAAQVTVQSSPTYNVQTSKSIVPIGGSLSASAQSVDPLLTQVGFSWFDPKGISRSAANVIVANGKAQSIEFFPDKEGVWAVKANFTDGNNLFAQITKTFFVVQPMPFTVDSMVAVTNSTGGFKINSTIANGIVVELADSNVGSGTALAGLSFVYLNSPPIVPTVASQLGVSPSYYVDVALNNTAIDGTALVSITSMQANSSSTLYYYSYAIQQWLQASGVTFVPSSNPFGIGTISGYVPVSELVGTPIAIANPTSTNTTYTVTFTESNLPSGTQWSIIFDGVTRTSTGSTIVLAGITPGIHNWSITTPIATTSGVQYITSPTSGTLDVPTQTNRTITYTTQYKLTMITNFGTTSPTGNQWYNAGSIISISASAPVANQNEQYVWNGWTGTGSGSTTTTSNTAQITLNDPITQTASWKHQYQITFTHAGLSSDASGTTVTISGTAKTYSQLPYNVWVDAGSSISMLYEANVGSTVQGKHYILTSVSGNTTANSLTVNNAATITGTYNPQVDVTPTPTPQPPTPTPPSASPTSPPATQTPPPTINPTQPPTTTNPTSNPTQRPTNKPAPTPSPQPETPTPTPPIPEFPILTVSAVLLITLLAAAIMFSKKRKKVR